MVGVNPSHLMKMGRVPGFEIHRTPSPINKIKHLRVQIAAKSSKLDSNPQPDATSNLTRRELDDHPPCPPTRRNHITQKVRIADQRTLYISVHDDAQPAEVFLRLKGADCSSELIGLYDVIARLMSLALLYGAPA